MATLVDGPGGYGTLIKQDSNLAGVVQEIEMCVVRFRRYYPSLRCPLLIPLTLPLPILPLFHHWRFEPALEEFQYLLVYYPLRNEFEKFIMRYAVKVFREVGIYDLGFTSS